MAIRKIRFIGDPCLNKVCKPVQKITPSIETLIEDMFDTMYEARGVGYGRRSYHPYQSRNH